MTSIGRNDLCPCGSGKKYKRCCLGDAEPASTPEGHLAHKRHAAETALFDDVVRFSRRRFGTAWADRALREVSELPPEEDEFSLLFPWLIYQRPHRGAPPARHFLDEQGEGLTEFQRTTLECNLAAWMSLFEVRRVEPGVGLELHDLLTHGTRFVPDVGASQTLEPWDTVLGMVTDYPEVRVVGGMHPQALGPVEATELLARVRRVFGVRTRPVKPARLSEQVVQVRVILEWRLTLAAQDLRALTPREMTNTDGDPMVSCSDHFDVVSGARPQVVKCLLAVEGAHPEGGDDDEAIVFTRPGNKMQAHWGNTIIGRAWFERGRLLLETNSVKRADKLRHAVERAAGALLKHRLRDLRDVGDLVENLSPASRGRVSQQAPPPEIQARIRQAIERHYETWPDTKLPALSGRTPRQAVTSRTLRPRLVALLKQFEQGEAGKPEAERFDMGKLWRELGLDPLQAGAVAPGGGGS